MNASTRSVIIKLFFAIVLLIALWLVVKWDSSVRSEQRAEQDSIIDQNTIGNYKPDTIVATHRFENNIHKMEGTISLPNPCYQMDVNAVVAESLPERVTLDFTITQPNSDQMCVQMIDDRPFNLEFSASENPVITAKVNNQEVMLVIDDQTGTLRQQEVE